MYEPYFTECILLTSPKQRMVALRSGKASRHRMYLICYVFSVCQENVKTYMVYSFSFLKFLEVRKFTS